MKRKLLVVTFIVFTTFISWGQINLTGDSKYELNVIGYQSRDKNACGDIYGLKDITVYYEDNSPHYLFFGRKSYANIDHRLPYTKHKKIHRVHFHETNRFKKWKHDCGGEDELYDQVVLNSQTSISIHRPQINNESKSVTVHSRPIVEIKFDKDKQYILGSEEKLTINLPDNLENNHYNWFYKNGNGDIIEFTPLYNQKNKLEIIGKDFLKEKDYGKIISVWNNTKCEATKQLGPAYVHRDLRHRQITCNFNPNDNIRNVCFVNAINIFNSQIKASESWFKSSSNILNFLYLPSAPKIIKKNTIQPKCSYDTGKITLTLDRELYDSEVLKLSLVDVATGKEAIANGKKRLKKGDLINNTFSFDSIQPGKKYRLDMVGFYKHNEKELQTYTDGVNNKYEFEIQKKTSVTLKKVIQYNKVYCFGGSDGAIKIEGLTGGTGNYKYVYKKQGKEYPENWTTFSGNNTLISGLASGTYFVKVRDTNNCEIRTPKNNEKEFTVVIEESAAKKVAFAEVAKVSPPNNYGAKDGYISVVIKGGTPKIDSTYNFIWKKGTTAIVNGTNGYSITTQKEENGYLIRLSNLDAGTYSLEVTDANYNNATQKNTCALLNQSFTIKQPVGISYTKKEVNCFGGNDGYITLTAQGGTPPYQYQYALQGGNYTKWTAFTKPVKISSLSEGKYIIQVKDATGTFAVKNGKKNTPTVQITQPSEAFQLNPTIIKAKGYGRTDGKMILKVTGGTKPYTFQIRKGSTTGTILSQHISTTSKKDEFIIIADSLSADNYYVTVKDAKYDTATSTTETCGIIDKKLYVAQPNPLQVTYNELKKISCNRNNGGTIIDSNNNKIPDNAEDGLVEITTKGGVKPYKYSWTFDNTPITLIDQTSINNTTHGTYKVKVTDRYDNSTDLTINVVEPTKLTVKATGLIKDCKTPNSGYAEAIVTGGTGNYTYAWNTNQTTQKIENVSNGTYTVIVQDEKKCTLEDTIVLGNNPKVTVSAKNTTGYGRSDGEISFVVTGGKPNDDGTYIFDIRKNPKTRAAITENITTTVKEDGSFVVKVTNLLSDAYFINVKDANFSNATSCGVEETITVKQPDPLKITYEELKGISCNQNNGGKIVDTNNNTIPDNAEDGIINTTTVGGTTPYTYQWFFNDTSITLDDPTNIDKARHGTYKVIVKDTYSNTDTLIINVIEPPKLTLKAQGKINNCGISNSAYAEAIVTGGTGLYTYSWNNGENTQKITNIPNSGTYTVIMNDEKKCTLEDTVVLGNNPIIKASSEKTTGYGRSDGAISFVITGGTPNEDGTYIFDIRKSTQTGTAISKNITTTVQKDGSFVVKVDKLLSDNYFIDVKDANFSKATSCSVKESIFVEQPDPLKITYEELKSISCNQHNGGKSTDINNNTIPDNAEDGFIATTTKGGTKPYSYEWFFNDTNITLDDPTNIDKAKHGIYKVIVTDKYINTDTLTIDVVEPPKLTMSLFSKIKNCASPTARMAWINVQGGTGTYNYYWSNGANTKTIDNITNGKYFVVVKDANKCEIEGTVVVGENPIIIDDVVIKKPSCNGTSDATITVKVSGGKNTPTLLWNTGETTSTISNLKAGTYTLTLSDGTNCGTVIKEFTIKDPEKLLVDLGSDITLCYGDSVFYDVTIDDENASYQWTNKKGNVISTNSKLTLKEAGTYSVTIKSSKGCIATDTVTIEASTDVLDIDFLTATHAYIEGTIKLVNISKGKTDRLEWVLPNKNTETISTSRDYTEIKFTKTGTYKIGLTGYLGKCKKTIYKTLIINENLSGEAINGNNAKSIIKLFTVSPNPNNGKFKVVVELTTKATFKLYIVDMLSRNVFSPIKKESILKTSLDFTNDIIPGNYIVVLEVDGELMYKKMIVK